MTERTTLAHLSTALMLEAPNHRHGIVLTPQQVAPSLSDIADIVHMGVPNSIESPWESASGGVGRTTQAALLAAIGEGIERYCAAIVRLPLRSRTDLSAAHMVDPQQWHLFTEAQRRDANFPFANIYSDQCQFTNAYDFQDNAEVWIPHPLVALRDDYQTGVPTSSGLAAGRTARDALLRAIQELIERDAFMVTWLHSVAARAIAMPQRYLEEVGALDGEVHAFDLTPAYSPFPVIAVAGNIAQRGRRRFSLGLACRDTWGAALEKAYLEWNQGVLFAGIYGRHADTSGLTNPAAVKSFDEHAMFYTLHPERWESLPMFADQGHVHEVSTPGAPLDTDSALVVIKETLAESDIRMYYRDITTVDAHQLGVSVVRATSPDLAAIFAHQEWPLVGGVENLLSSRYPWAPAAPEFPNPMPHPLG